jgi:hypothetical protein
LVHLLDGLFFTLSCFYLLIEAIIIHQSIEETDVNLLTLTLFYPIDRLTKPNQAVHGDYYNQVSVVIAKSTMTKKSIPKDLAAKREYFRLSVARHRAKRANTTADLQTSINAARQRLGLPPKTFPTTPNSSISKRDTSKLKLVYLPPEEELKQMTPEELSKWKVDERKKRKLARAREKKVWEDQLRAEWRRELIDLERRVKVLDEAAREFVDPIVVEENNIKNGGELEDVADGVAMENVKVEQVVSIEEDLKPESVKSNKVELDNKTSKKMEVTVSTNNEISQDLFTLNHDIMGSQDFYHILYDTSSGHQDVMVMTSKDLDFVTEDELEEEFTIFDGEELFTSMDELIPVEDMEKKDLLFENLILHVFDDSA